MLGWLGQAVFEFVFVQNAYFMVRIVHCQQTSIKFIFLFFKYIFMIIKINGFQIRPKTNETYVMENKLKLLISASLVKASKCCGSWGVSGAVCGGCWRWRKKSKLLMFDGSMFQERTWFCSLIHPGHVMSHEITFSCVGDAHHPMTQNIPL